MFDQLSYPYQYFKTLFNINQSTATMFHDFRNPNIFSYSKLNENSSIYQMHVLPGSHLYQQQISVIA
jgi:hypothetical protein